MAYDEGLAEIMRGDLDGTPGLTERRMFGGLAFMLNGHMVCGVHAGGAMFRVGKEHEAQARAIPGTGPMEFTGKPMGGMVSADEEVMADDERRAALMALAIANAEALPPK
ncbi:TfoX/Sxy family protein [Limimaricola pyoseonensis]|uniref:TfoX N-terminal domain-containing protein n=1 Tax=Limimaricola pyoseonensis TaxID=521013 RepID=A0A1G7A340_9RHOB|nr:TfoX/Sxy family protein [Limimaricola pyoseonensis]SDE09249.1 TfoX N-terminal domain-containing protein [Limimaricola pyoseonensis]